MLNTERQSSMIRCSHCGQLRLMHTAADYTHIVEREIDDVGFYQERFRIYLLVCSGCHAVNLAVEDEDGQRRVWHVPLDSVRGRMPSSRTSPDSQAR